MRFARLLRQKMRQIRNKIWDGREWLFPFARAVELCIIKSWETKSGEGLRPTFVMFIVCVCVCISCMFVREEAKDAMFCCKCCQKLSHLLTVKFLKWWIILAATCAKPSAVLVIDTTNDIGGDGDQPLPSLGHSQGCIGNVSIPVEHFLFGWKHFFSSFCGVFCFLFFIFFTNHESPRWYFLVLNSHYRLGFILVSREMCHVGCFQLALETFYIQRNSQLSLSVNWMCRSVRNNSAYKLACPPSVPPSLIRSDFHLPPIIRVPFPPFYWPFLGVFHD